MASFKDSKGREWTLRLTHGLAMKIKDTVSVDLYKAFDGGSLAEIANDPAKLVSAVYVMIEKQADAAKVEPEDFGDSLDGDAIDAMGDAFIAALVDFRPKQKAALLKVIKKSREVMDFQEQRAMKAMEEMPLDVLADAAFSKLSTKLPEKPESIPPPLASES